MSVPELIPETNPATFITHETIARLVGQGKIRRKKHATIRNLELYKYSIGYDFFTDEDAHIVRYFRGLVFDWHNGKVVALPLPKFFNHFNYTTHELRELFKKEYLVEEKQDGSCVLLWAYNGEWHWSTLGSFDSPQAKMAKQIFDSAAYYDELDENYTYVFEVIYPENRIILDYGDTSKLVYITQFHRETGAEKYEGDFDSIANEYIQTSVSLSMGLPYGLDVPGVEDLDQLIEVVKDRKEEEGYVVTFYADNGHIQHERVKFKTRWYFEKTRERSELERHGIVKLALYNSEALLDEELMEKYKKEIRAVISALSWLHEHIEYAVSGLKWIPTRKQQAEEILKLDIPKALHTALFAELDGKDESCKNFIRKALEDESPETIFEAADGYVNKLRKE